MCMQAKQEVLITSIHSCYYGTKRSILKVTLCGKKGNALLKSAPFCLIIESRKLRVSISKILLNWQKKMECTLVYNVQTQRSSPYKYFSKLLYVSTRFSKIQIYIFFEFFSQDEFQAAWNKYFSNFQRVSSILSFI